MGFDTHCYVRGFDANHNIVISKIFYHMHFVKRTLYNSFRSNTMVSLYKFFFQGAAVYPHANWYHPLPSSLYHF